MTKIGVISDNHGYINPRVYRVFDGVELILHAGDIGDEDVVTALEALAPVKAVTGNIDTFPLTTRYPDILTVQIDSLAICVRHIFNGLQEPCVRQAVQQELAGNLNILIYGHSHKARLQLIDGTYIFNPGSAGKRRFSLRPSVGMIHLSDNGQFTLEIIYLDTREGATP